MSRIITTSALALTIGASAAMAQDVTLTLWTESATAPRGHFRAGVLGDGQRNNHRRARNPVR